MFTSISFERNFGCMDSFSHSFSDASKDVLLMDSPKGDISSPKLQVSPIAEDMDHQSAVEESNDVDFDSDYVVSDESSDDGDDADCNAVVSDYEAHPDVYPIEFVRYFKQHFHGKGFRYVACQWTKKFTKPNRIYRNLKCKFVYYTNKAKLIIKKVYK
ncbi:hypothetical protein Hanom_Chr15g01372261 [Helianthus anomalus]